MKTNITTSGVLLQVRSRLGNLLGSVYRQWRRRVDLSFKDLGLSDATRMPLLALYVQEQPLRQKELADALSLDTFSLVACWRNGERRNSSIGTATPPTGAPNSLV